jgi:hypothetical protein
MKKEKYTAQIDGVLTSFIKSASKSISEKDRVAVTEENEKFIKKIAFDVYRVDNDPYDGLWLMQEADDGKYLVRASDPHFDHKKNGDWEAITDYSQENITLAYKNVPIVRFSSKEFGFTSDTVSSFKSAVLDKASTDEEFLKGVFSMQPESKRAAISNTFPEFKKFV